MNMLALVLVMINCLCFTYASVLTKRQLRSEMVFNRRLNQLGNMNTFEERRPLIIGNFIGTCIAAGLGFGLFSFMFSTTDFSWWVILLQIAVIMVIDDIWFYTCHRLLHGNAWLFKKIHSIHHRVRSPLPLDYLYVQPLEWMMGALGVLSGLLAVYVYWGSVSAYAIVLYAVFRSVHEVHIHSGMPSRGLARLKYLGSAEHHGMHHAKLKYNYASTFKWLDRVLGTKEG
jgi:methylsterol monooxygenase